MSTLRTVSTKRAGLSDLEEAQRWDGPNYTTRGGCGLHRSHLWETRKQPADVLRTRRGHTQHSANRGEMQTHHRLPTRSWRALHAAVRDGHNALSPLLWIL